jgi:hypothetical protein
LQDACYYLFFLKEKKMQKFSTGQRADKSGQYQVIGPRGGVKNVEITMIKGNVFPPHPEGTSFVLVDSTKNKSGK